VVVRMVFILFGGDITFLLFKGKKRREILVAKKVLENC
jgi:hypothetical protein